MRTRITRAVLLGASALSAAAAVPALAQDAPGDSAPAATDSGDIIVTARRTEERMQDVPISLTVYNQEQLDKRNIVNIGDLGNYTPSMMTNSKYGPEKASFIIRGFVQDLGTQPTVGVYFADVVGPRSGGSTTSGNGLGFGNMFDLQNVQVLKGPQGTLFGRNTTGGAVLLVPHKPTDKLEGYVEGSYGNYDMKRVQAVANIPLSDTFKVRLGVDRLVRDGYLINHSDYGPDALGNADVWAARLSIVGNLTPDLENYTIFSWSKSDNYGVVPRIVGCNRDSTSPLAALGCAQLDRQADRGDSFWDVEASESDPKEQQETWQVINTTTWHASDSLTIKNIASYAEFRERIGFSLEGENFRPALTLIGIRTPPGYDASSQSTFTEELQLIGTAADGRLTWQAGGYLENSDPLGYTSQFTVQLINCTDAFNFECAAGGSSGSISWPFQKTVFRNRGLYAQATYDITEQLSLTAGFRYTWDRMTHSYDQVTIRFPTANNPVISCPNVVRVPNPNGPGAIVIPDISEHATCNSTNTAQSSAPTWLINLDYKPNDDILLYAKWARGYRAGGAASANILFETWQPEKVDSYEVGAKTTWRGSSVRGYFNVAAYYNDFTNQQVSAALIRSSTSPLIGGLAIINAGKSRIWGFEIDSSLTFFDDFRLDLGYSYLNTRVKSLTVPTIGPELAPFYSVIAPTVSANGELGLSPKHRLSVTGTYTLPLDPSVGRVSVGITYVYTADQLVSQATAPAFTRLPASNLVNLNFDWNGIAGTPIDLSAFVTNLTNEAVPVNVSNAYGSFGFESQMTNMPRMYGVRLRYTFGR
jgi:iron complex outermembrane receptor protein